MFNLIKSDLPNFPDEIIYDWLEPLADGKKWPPNFERSSWGAILLYRPIEFWSRVKWNKVELDLSGIILKDQSFNAIQMMHEAHVLGVQNGFSETTDSRKRFLESFDYLVKIGTFPRPIVFLNEGSIYEIADGHHRYLAWRMVKTLHEDIARSISDSDAEILEQFKSKLGITEVAHLREKQEAWVASIAVV